MLGATGSGKSFLLNFLVTHAQKYAPLTVVLDLGHSYRKLATLLGGRYVEVGLRQHGVTINPFALEPTPNTYTSSMPLSACSWNATIRTA